MSDKFWAVFWHIFGGVVFMGMGAGIAFAFSGVWWIGALIALVIYLIILVLIHTGGDGTFLIFDFD